jgi:hypothetical protein
MDKGDKVEVGGTWRFPGSWADFVGDDQPDFSPEEKEEYGEEIAWLRLSNRALRYGATLVCLDEKVNWRQTNGSSRCAVEAVGIAMRNRTGLVSPIDQKAVQTR